MTFRSKIVTLLLVLVDMKQPVNAQAGVLGSLDASLRLYKMVFRSVGPSMLSSRFREYQ